MSNKVVVIHQPDFIPYLGFFDRLLKADIFVVFDMVQFERRGWTNRDKIKTDKGERWITVPVKKTARETPINKIMLADDNSWREEHLRLFHENYKNALFYTEILPYIEKLYAFEGKRMMDFNMCSIEMLIELLDIKIDIRYASNMQLSKKSNELIVEVLNTLGEKFYLSGTGARDYFEEKTYTDADIEVIWQDYKPVKYPQQFGPFIPYLSSIDTLFNCGIAGTRKLLRGESL